MMNLLSIEMATECGVTVTTAPQPAPALLHRGGFGEGSPLDDAKQILRCIPCGFAFRRQFQRAVISGLLELVRCAKPDGIQPTIQLFSRVQSPVVPLMVGPFADRVVRRPSGVLHAGQ